MAAIPCDVVCLTNSPAYSVFVARSGRFIPGLSFRDPGKFGDALCFRCPVLGYVLFCVGTWLGGDPLVSCLCPHYIHQYPWSATRWDWPGRGLPFHVIWPIRHLN